MGNVEDIRKALEEFVAPSLTELKTRVGSLEVALPAMETRLLRAIDSLEARLIKTIDGAKTEVLLMVRVSDLSARNAELEAKVAFLSKRTEQDTANQ